MLGALLIVLIRQSSAALHLDQNYEWIVIGCAIIIAVVLDQGSAAWPRGAWWPHQPENPMTEPRRAAPWALAALAAVLAACSGAPPLPAPSS